MARSSALAKTALSSDEPFGPRLARLRRERGFTQAELGERSGLIQALISDYERDKLRPYADVVVRLATALGVSTDELLGVHRPPERREGAGKDRRFLRRLQLLGALPKRDQDALLRTIDAFLVRAKAS